MVDRNPHLGLKKTYDIYLATYDKRSDKYTYESKPFENRQEAIEIYEQIRAQIKDQKLHRNALVVTFQGMHKYGKGWPDAIEELKKRAKLDWAKLLKKNNIDPNLLNS